MGDLLGDESRLSDAGEEDGTVAIEEGLGECKSLGKVEVLEEEVEVLLLGLEEVEEVSWVD